MLNPLKAASKRLEGRGSDSRFGAIYQVIPVFEYILSYYEQKLIDYEKVEYDAHPEAPEVLPSRITLLGIGPILSWPNVLQPSLPFL